MVFKSQATVQRSMRYLGEFDFADKQSELPEVESFGIRYQSHKQ